jgi:Domain of unknown function (DUF222)
VSEASFPGPGPDGEQPPPGIPARDEAPGMPAEVPEDDWDADAEMASYIADLDAGQARIPEEWEVEGPAATISLGDAADVDLVELAAMLGPDGLGGEVFARDRSADAMRPGPVLAALTEQAAGDLGRLTDNQVVGAMSAASRLAARAEYLRLRAVAEFTRRREAQLADATARKVPRGCRDGEFPDAELAYELVTSSNAARDTMDLADDLPARLPRTCAAMGAGLIDEYRVRLIWRPTRHLTDDDAARADEILAELAPGLRYDQLARKAVAVAMKLDPEAFKRGKEQARAERQRVVAGREESGNAYLSARELAVEDALASKAHIDALAVMLRRGGLPGTLQRLRVLAFNDLTQGRDPLNRLTDPGTADPAGPDGHRDGPPAGGQPRGDADAANGSSGDRRDQSPPPGKGPGHGSGGGGDQTGRHPGTGTRDGDDDAIDGDDDASWDGCPDMPEWQHERRGTREDHDYHGAGPPTRPPAPFPALINLTVPAGTAYGWSSAPGEAGGWGLTDPGDTRRLLQAASMHPRTRLCVTLLGPDGTAVAHGCARGQHPWIPPPIGERNRDGPDEQQAAALAGFLRDLDITFTPIAKGTCDHADREDPYTPSRKLQHQVRARTARCTAPGCGAQAVHCDLDHTLPYPAGITCQCDLAPACRRHHRCKQAPGWRLTQPEPGVMCWTTPAGRSYTTRPTVYEM